MTLTGIECWSESAQLECVAVCRPAALEVATELEASAVGFIGAVSRQDAEDASGRLCEALTRFGCRLFDLGDFLPESARAVSDASVNRVFVRDTAAVVGRQLVTGTAAFAARIAEFDATHAALAELIHGGPRDAAPVEGTGAGLEFGDVFLLDEERIFVNLGLRSDARALQGFLETAWGAGFQEVGVVCIPEHLGIIHLDLAFNVLGPRAVLARTFLKHLPVRVITPAQAPQWESFEGYFTRRGRKVHALPASESPCFLSNYIFLGPQLLLASQSAAPRLQPLVKELGIEVEGVDIAALERGNGSVRCLTLPLKRRATYA
ncbi:arginine deiminase family protein [Corallococcus sp. bb12-1]|uniref:arginine deiminase family protein n=1 Tax=Corallococcus sp. bb12-1 TaxID=2996784 RepID=UPI00227180BD|nr:arginine deiminase family protein [Corallococcus sp. bb12-1]MCY1045880.1 arginine deiminase family protein [Corallococcus sp. bb12-1]